jgi:hypothetical protein
VPIALNCTVCPAATDGVTGATTIDVRVGTTTTAVTVSVVEPVTVEPVTLAVIVVDPAATGVANPPEVIVAVDVVDEVQVAVAVKSCVVLLL